LLDDLLLASGQDSGSLGDEVLVDVGQDTTTSNRSSDEQVELFVSSDSELQVTGSDTLDSEILGGVTGQFEYFCGQILHNGRNVDCSLCSDSDIVGVLAPQESMDTADRELKSRLGRSSRENLCLGASLCQALLNVCVYENINVTRCELNMNASFDARGFLDDEASGFVRGFKNIFCGFDIIAAQKGTNQICDVVKLRELIRRAERMSPVAQTLTKATYLIVGFKGEETLVTTPTYNPPAPVEEKITFDEKGKGALESDFNFSATQV